ncbi:MAG TPA: hypothetical protein ENN56_03160 [Firmicutes bacterium]|nr:hypothetical protein [Bacillota bacterium]
MRRVVVAIVILAALVITGILASSTNAEEPTRVRITNGLSRWSIHYVYISSTSSSSWGDDQLNSDQVLSPGASETWTLSAGNYDLRVKDEDGDMYTRRGVCVPRGMLVEWRVTIDDLDR